MLLVTELLRVRDGVNGALASSDTAPKTFRDLQHRLCSTAESS